MMTISNTVKQIFESNNIEFFYLITIMTGTNIFDNNSYRHITTHYADIIMSTGVTYISENTIVDIDPPRYSNSVDRASYKIVITDSSYSFKNFFEQGAAGSDVIVRMGFYNTQGYPLTNINDTIMIYRGYVDSQSYNIDTEQNNIQAVLECSSPMADLDLVKPYYTTAYNHKQFYPNDTAFDLVFKDSSNIKLNWGKI